MPWSWVRVSAGTSPSLARCVGDDRRRAKYEDCTRQIVARHDCSPETILWEANGKFMRVHFYWDTPRNKRAVLLDLEATQVLDLYADSDIDDLAAELDQSAD